MNSGAQMPSKRGRTCPIIGFSMEDLPELLISSILKKIDTTVDRNSVSLTCKRLCTIEGEQRGCLRVGCRSHLGIDSLIQLCIRFPNITKLEIDYSDCVLDLGNQLDNQALQLLSSRIPYLKELTLSFCPRINDIGLSHLAACRDLMSIKLNSLTSISSVGILLLAVGCEKLSTLHIIRCTNVHKTKWLEYLGKFGMLEDLSIKYCKGIEEYDLMKLGLGWKKLKRFEMEVHPHSRCEYDYDCASVDSWQISCEMLKEISLINCDITPGRGLSYILRKCVALEKLHLDLSNGIENGAMIILSQICSNLRCLSLHLPYYSTHMGSIGLGVFAQGCMLEEVELSFSGIYFPSFASFSRHDINLLIERCPVRVLALNNIYFFDNICIDTLCSAHFLQKLELVECQQVTDVGLQLVVHFPCLIILKLRRCLGVTDIGLLPLVGTQKLELLIVEYCPQISEKGVKGTASSISYMQDTG